MMVSTFELETYRPLPKGLTIKSSEIDGLGLHSMQNFDAGFVFGETHVLVHSRDRHEWIRTPLGGFINHADEPNCQRHQIRVKPDFDKWSIMTLEDIEEGCELTLKYKLYDPKKI